MAQITETFAIGSEQVTVALDVTLPVGGEAILTGDIGGLIPAGTVARLRGACRLTANLHIRGTLLCDPTGVDLDGQNLFDIHTHDGTLNLVGVEKSAWVRWGDPVIGWQTGDRIWVDRTAPGIGSGVETIWQGSWANTVRHVGAPDVLLPNGMVMRPEVVNLAQTVTLRNLKRIMVHEASAPNPQTLKWVRVLNSGEVGVFDSYPIHFHTLGDYSRGSLLEGVVVEGGKNHAFVPHTSHGITLRDCVGFNTIGSVYWWNEGQNTADLTFDHCLALKAVSDSTNHATGFFLQLGTGSLLDCAAAGINGGDGASGGFRWPSFPGNWDSDGLVAHNNGQSGIYVWNNGPELRTGHNWISYRNLNFGVMLGAYQNAWAVSDLVAFENSNGNDVIKGDLVLRSVPFSTAPAPRVIGGRVGTVVQGHHNVQTQSNGLQPTLLIDVEMDSYTVRDLDGMWVDLVRCLKGGADLEPADIVVVLNHPSNRWRGQRRDGTAWQKTSNGTVTAIPPFWTGP